MRKPTLVVLLVAVFGIGLIAAGCGSSSDTTSSSAATTSSGDTTSSSSSSSSGNTPDDVYNACLDVVKGTPAESAGTTACQQAKDAFQQCEDQANAAGGSAGSDALAACQDAAKQTIDQLKAAGG